MGFNVGDIVAVQADPSRVGPVIQILQSVDGFGRYRVFHEAGSMREYAEDQLVLAAAQQEATTAGLSPEEFRARLVAARLSHPLTDHVYSLRAARIKYVPFQFRPLLRLARADEPRLLIADDVGVGKTIEAGLIMKELAARQPLDHVLVLCPKALTVKWREEMRRFDEDFRVLDSSSLRYCLNEAHLDGAWPEEYRRAIVHYELFARTAYLKGDGKRKKDKGLRELDPPPAFDLVIADEAHHLRTPGTNSHELAAYLSEISTALVLLSATPVQTQARDLFTLLNLLRPDLFRTGRRSSRSSSPTDTSTPPYGLCAAVRPRPPRRRSRRWTLRRTPVGASRRSPLTPGMTTCAGVWTRPP
ncbi:DEAD/DEAH box helicase [Micromonospora sp. NPDC049580]|uniref:DEAD/DEAH box helicase n=1 Tax=Micromonospora sp. NPDC049580 TaxID=3154832 RepID=UPI003415E579